jgi:hypothetical protein
MTRLTREQAAILGCYTGICFGPFGDVHKKAEELLDRPIWTHEFGLPDLWAQIKAKVEPEFMAIAAMEDEPC